MGSDPLHATGIIRLDMVVADVQLTWPAAPCGPCNTESCVIRLYVATRDFAQRAHLAGTHISRRTRDVASNTPGLHKLKEKNNSVQHRDDFSADSLTDCGPG